MPGPGGPGPCGSRHLPCLPLAGREPQLRESLLEEFREVALGVGIPEDAIFTMPDRGNGTPPHLTLLSPPRPLWPPEPLGLSHPPLRETGLYFPSSLYRKGTLGPWTSSRSHGVDLAELRLEPIQHSRCGHLPSAGTARIQGPLLGGNRG